MKYISWLSGLPATGSPASTAIQRTVSLRYSPIGRRRRPNSVCVSREEHVGLVLPGVGPLEQPVPGAQAPAAARILGVFHRAAPLALRRRVVPLDGSEAHRDADDLAVLLLQQEGGAGGINASVHGHDGSSFAHGMSVA